jgi:hypothetical protein
MMWCGDMPKKITNIDKPELKQIADLAAEALNVLFAEYGLTVKRGNGHYARSGEYADMNFTFTVVGAVAGNRDAEAYRQSASLYDLKSEWLNKTVTSGRDTFKLVGLAPRRSRAPIILQRADGKQFLYPAGMVKALFESQHGGANGVTK